MNRPKVVVVGSLNMDIVIESQRFPQVGETIMGQTVHFIPGGKGANQAIALSRLGAETTMIGTVGKDDFGAALIHSLEISGIKSDTVKIMTNQPTGIASILLAEGDNHIVVVPGANAFCTVDDVYRYEEAMKEADVLLLQLEIPLETVCAAAKLAKKHHKMVILNPAPAQSLPSDLLKNIDLITPNRSELSLLTGIEINSEDQLETAAKVLLEMGPECTVVTLGAQGSAFLTKQNGWELVESFSVPVVDTTGAGDAFNAGLAFALAKSMDITDAVTFASKVSALAVTKLGAQAGMPTLEEVEKYSFLKR